MLPLTLISIKPFLWNRVPHRSRLLTCLFPFLWHREFLQNKLPMKRRDPGPVEDFMRVSVTLLDVRPLKSLMADSQRAFCHAAGII